MQKRHEYRGYCYAAKGDNDAAIADFTHVVRLRPDHAEAYRFRGLAYWKEGNYDKAIVDFTEAIRLNPGYAEAFDGRGKAYEAKGDFDKAVADHHEAARLDPTFTEAYRADFHTYLSLLPTKLSSENDKAIADCTKAIQLDPEDSEAYCNRGAAYGKKGDFGKAIADLTEAIRLAPDLCTHISAGALFLARRAITARLSPTSARPPGLNRTSVVRTATGVLPL